MSKICGPSSKGVWNRKRSPAQLSKKAKSSSHSGLRMKGKPKYPGGSYLVSSLSTSVHNR